MKKVMEKDEIEPFNGFVKQEIIRKTKKMMVSHLGNFNNSITKKKSW